MCSCTGGPSTDEERFKIMEGTPCEAITIDLLMMFKNPIDCYLQHKLWANIGSSEEEMQAASNWIANFINQKNEDNFDCNNLSELIVIRIMFSKILNLGVCL